VSEAEVALAKLVEAHEAKLQPVLLRREAAVRAVNMASSAERSLRESVPRAARDRLLSGIIAEERTLSAARESLEKEIRDVLRVVDTTESYGESASSTDKARLPAAKQRLATLRQRMRESDEAAAVLTSKRSTVERDLLKPEVW
jgi:chromosome segregation ATPase